MELSMRETMVFTVNAPVDRVFDFCADFEATTPVLSPETEVTQVPSGEVGVGAVFRFVHHPTRMVGRSEIVEYAPPHTLRVVTDWGRGPFTTLTTVQAAEGGGSLVRVYNDAKPITIWRWMQPFSWVFRPFLRGVVAKANARYVEFARQRLEV
jgi:hypothetical protein